MYINTISYFNTQYNDKYKQLIDVPCISHKHKTEISVYMQQMDLACSSFHSMAYVCEHKGV